LRLSTDIHPEQAVSEVRNAFGLVGKELGDDFVVAVAGWMTIRALTRALSCFETALEVIAGAVGELETMSELPSASSWRMVHRGVPPRVD
jgi:hypothetical protein